MHQSVQVYCLYTRFSSAKLIVYCSYVNFETRFTYKSPYKASISNIRLRLQELQEIDFKIEELKQ